MPDYLSLDYETFSRVDLPTVGTSKYARDSSTEVLMAAYAFNGDPVQQWVPAEFEEMPSDLRDGLRDPKVIKRAWNKPFEWNITKHVLGIEVPHREWRDVMVLAMSLSLPGKLENAGAVIDLPQDKRKMARGKALMRRFSMTRKPTKKDLRTRLDWTTHPEEWEEYKEYNRQDVEAERAIWRRVRKWNLPEDEWELWFLDQEINEAGIPINMRVVRNAIEVSHEIVRQRLDEMSELTGLSNPNSTKQLLPWLREQGYPFNDLQKGHVRLALERLDPADMIDESVLALHRVLELRQETSKTSFKKYQALAEAIDDDDLLRYTLQFCGAGRTWRWSGRKYQPQNLARPAPALEKMQDVAVRHLEMLDAQSIELVYEKPMDLLSTCVRPVVQAPKGHLFGDADLNAIENRVLGWLANDEKILDVFNKGRDPYVDFSTNMFGGTYDERWKEFKGGDKSKRTLAKPPVLGCGYMLSAGREWLNEDTGETESTGLLAYARNMFVVLTPEQATLAVKVWRETFKRAVAFWGEIEAAAKRCVRTGQEEECGHVSFDISGPFLRMRLPSGRYLHYCRPALENKMMPWGKTKTVLTYEGLNDKNHWTSIQTHPGKLTENADQAIARDLLAHVMRLARKEGLDIRLHVHDQIVVLSPEARAERDLKILLQCMSERPRWAPDLPLAAEGTISRIFIKD